MGNRRGRSVLPDDGMSVRIMSRAFSLRPSLESIPRFQEMKEALLSRFISAKNLIEDEVSDVVVVSHRHCGWWGCRDTCRTQDHSAVWYRNSLVGNYEKHANHYMCARSNDIMMPMVSLGKEAVSDANKRKK